MRSTIRYLSAADVLAAMPPVAERLILAERTMVALVHDAELPPKLGVHPRPPGSFAHAMPALLRPRDGGLDDDLLGLKWVTGVPDNRSRDLPAIHATVLLSDPATGAPRAILDGGPITALRTAAVSGVAIQRFRPMIEGRATRAVIVGAGVQCRSHLEVLGHVVPGVEVAIVDRHPDRAAGLVAEARATAGIGGATAVPPDAAQEATRRADIVVTAASFTDPAHRQSMDETWFARDALVVPVDYATMCAASVAAGAALFLVDERGQFLANRDAGQFDGYPDPGATLGEAIIAGTRRPANGRVVVTHLGVGLADIIFGAAILDRAEAAGRGTVLHR